VKKASGYRKTRFLLYPLLCLVSILAIGFLVKLRTVEIGDNGQYFPVSEGEIFVLEYTHSMYQVPVREKFRVEDTYFILFHVETQSDAVLEYFGIGDKKENNVRKVLKEFSIPVASIGKHMLYIKDRKIPLDAANNNQENINIKLLKIPLITYIIHTLWR
jgi:hypothetical protein